MEQEKLGFFSRLREKFSHPEQGSEPYRRQVLPADRRPHHRRDQQAPAAERARRLVPGGSVLPPERADHRRPAPAGKAAGRHAAGGIFPQGRRTGHPQAMPGDLGIRFTASAG